MADFNIDVIVDPKKAKAGLKTVDDNLEKTGKTANKLRDTINKALAFAGISVGVSELIKLADTYTNIQNRLRTVTTTQQELIGVTNELFEISNRTRQSYEATATVYARTANATKDLGLSQKETLQFTESLNQAVALSGATATEAENALIQLSQGLASGTLRGDELNSVLEQLPVVADVITESLGVTRGELRELGSDGKITAGIITNAFAEAREELAVQFGEAVPTIGQSFTVLKNEILRTVGALDEASGASELFAKSIIFLSENLDTAIRLLQTISIVLGVTFAKQAIGSAIAGVKALTKAIALNPIGALVIAIGLAVAALIAFSDKIKISGDSIATLADAAAVTWEFIIDGLTILINFFSENFGFISEFASEVFGDVNLSIEGVLRFAATTLSNYYGLWIGTYRAIVAIWQGLPEAFKEIFTNALNGAIAIVEKGINQISGAISNVTDFVGLGEIPDVELNRIGQNFEGAGKELSQSIKDGFASGFEDTQFIEDSIDTFISAVEDKAAERIKGEQIAAAGIGSLADDAEGTQKKTSEELLADDPYLTYLQSGAALYGQALADRNQVAKEYDELLIQQAKEAAEKKIQLDQSLLSSLSSTSQGLTNIIKQSAGENSSAYRISFLAQQGFALATIALNTELAATAALAPPPIGLGPVGGAGYAAAIRLNGAVSAGIVAAQTVAGLVSSYSGGSTASPTSGSSNASVTSASVPESVSTPTASTGNQIQVNINGTNLSQGELTQAMKDVFDSDEVIITQGQAQFQEIAANG